MIANRHRFPCTLRVLALLPLLLFASTAEARPQTDAARYAQVGSRSAALRNLPDAKGIVLAEVAPGTIVRLYGERANWSSIEAARRDLGYRPLRTQADLIRHHASYLEVLQTLRRQRARAKLWSRRLAGST